MSALPKDNTLERAYRLKAEIAAAGAPATPEQAKKLLEKLAKGLHAEIQSMQVYTRVTIKSANLGRAISYPEQDFLGLKSSAKKRALFHDAAYGSFPLMETLSAGKLERHSTFSFHFDRIVPNMWKLESGHAAYNFGETISKNLKALITGLDLLMPADWFSGGNLASEPIALLELRKKLSFDCIYFIPVSLTGIEGGGITLLADRPLRIEEIRRINFLADELLMDLIVADHRAATTRQANRSAAAAIFTHAFAHDIGAHALSPIADSLNSPGVNFPTLSFTPGDLANFCKYLQYKSSLWASLADMDKPAAGGDIVKLSELHAEVKKHGLLFRKMLVSELDGLEPRDVEIKFRVNGSEDLGDAAAWLPYGKTAGSQLLYTIIETAIRNTKHWVMCAELHNPPATAVKRRKAQVIKDGLVITLDFHLHRNYKGLWQVDLSNGLALKERAQAVATEIGSKFRGLSIIENGRPVRKGSTETLICAALLRGAGIDSLLKQEPASPPLIEAKASRRKILIYRFYMHKGESFKVITPNANASRNGVTQATEDSSYRTRFYVTTALKHLAASGKIRLWCDNALSQHSSEEAVYRSWLRHWLGVTDISLEKSGAVFSLKVCTRTGKHEFSFAHHHKAPILETVTCSSDSDLWQSLRGLKVDSKVMGLAETLLTPILIIDQRAHAKDSLNSAELLKMNLQTGSPETAHGLDRLLAKPPRLIIIHSSLLESLCKQAKCAEHKKIEEILNKSADSKAMIYLTSGKSEPTWTKAISPVLSHRVKFIPWADIESLASRFSTKLDQSDMDTLDLFEAKQQLLEILLSK